MLKIVDGVVQSKGVDGVILILQIGCISLSLQMKMEMRLVTSLVIIVLLIAIVIAGRKCLVVNMSNFTRLVSA